jgi:mono/diheme cytochrome c family protein
MPPAYRTARISKMERMTIPSSCRGRRAPLHASLALLAVILPGIVAVSGCHSKPELTAQQAEGKHLYEVRCAHCHRDNDLGLKKVPPDLRDMFASGNLPSGPPATDARVRYVVLAGKGMMPAFNGRFNEEQMSALLAYLHTGLQ